MTRGSSRPNLPDVRRAPFGTTPSGELVEAFTLTNTHGLTLCALSYGGIIVSVMAPDRHGRLGDVVLGYESLEDYHAGTSYFGAIVGRVVNRISGSCFVLDGKTYRLSVNRPPNHLHGGLTGFDRAVWRTTPFRDGDTAVGLTLEHRSPDGDQGYPGNLDVQARYDLTNRNELIVDFLATSDHATPVNLTQHSYFNLAGHGDILGHRLRIDADTLLPMHEDLTPTGRTAPVAGTPFDFRTLTAIGARIGEDDEQLRIGGGYDHNFVIKREGPGLVHAAHVVEPASGRTLDVYTTEPGMQFYSGNSIDGRVAGKEGRVYGPRSGLCLETQHYPDSPNQPGFPSTILRPGAEFRSRTVFAFGVTGQTDV